MFKTAVGDCRRARKEQQTTPIRAFAASCPETALDRQTVQNGRCVRTGSRDYMIAVFFVVLELGFVVTVQVAAEGRPVSFIAFSSNCPTSQQSLAA